MAALVLSAGAASATDVTFYGHVFGAGLGAPMPANTQFPAGEEDWATGLTDTPCGPAIEECDRHATNKLVLFSTAGPVKVKSQRGFEYAELHNERGLSQSVDLDTSSSVRATLHMTPGAMHAWFHNPDETPCIGTDPPENVPCLYPYWRWHPGGSPDFVVRAWLVAAVLGPRGDAAGERPPMGEAWANGTARILAHGESEPVTAVQLDGYGGYPRVWKIDVDLGPPQASRVDANESLGFVFSWENRPAGQRVGTMTWRLNTGEFFPTTFTLPVRNAFTVELVHVEEVHGKLAILGVMNTPWGSYDVDPASIALAIRDSDGREVEPERIRRIADYSVAHGGHYRPVNVTYVWDHVADRLPAGAYSATISASNFQGSAASSTTATFEVRADGTLVRAEDGRGDVQTFDDEDVDELVGREGGRGGATGFALPALAAGLALFRRRRP